MSTSGQELNARQQAFVREYAKEPNAKAAAIKAGYSEKTARQIGSRLLTRVDIKSAIRARGAAALARLEVTEEMVLQELAAVAFSNIKRFTRWTSDGELVVLDSAEIPDALACAIESVEEQTLTSTNKDGTRTYERVKRRVKLYSKLDALGKLADYLGLTDTMTPRVVVHVVTGIKRELPEPKAVTIEAEPVTDQAD